MVDLLLPPVIGPGRLIIMAEMFFTFELVTDGGGGGGATALPDAGPFESSEGGCLGGGGGFTVGGLGDGLAFVVGPLDGPPGVALELVCEFDRCSDDRLAPPGGCGAWPLWAGMSGGGGRFCWIPPPPH